MVNIESCREKQSAVIPFIINDGVIEICLVTTSASNHWIIPKGVVAPFMSPENSALKEAYEEAGIFGHVSSDLFSKYEFKKNGVVHEVKIFLLEITQVAEQWDEMDIRERMFLDVDMAIKVVRPEIKSALEKFKEWHKKNKKHLLENEEQLSLEEIKLPDNNKSIKLSEKIISKRLEKKILRKDAKRQVRKDARKQSIKENQRAEKLLTRKKQHIDVAV